MARKKKSRKTAGSAVAKAVSRGGGGNKSWREKVLETYEANKGEILPKNIAFMTEQIAVHEQVVEHFVAAREKLQAEYDEYVAANPATEKSATTDDVAENA